MDLTPIRVRGRRKKPAKNNHDTKPITAPPRGPKAGRPLLSLEAKRLSSQSSLKHKRRRLISTTQAESVAQAQSRKGGKGKLSRLERLPVELLEKIFLYALNVNFARCSPVLTAAVSSERVYRVLVLLAFWKNPLPSLSLSATGIVRNKGNDAVVRTLRPFDSAPLDEEEQRLLQTAVLRCKWCTLGRVLRQLPDLMQLAVQRYWVDAGIQMQDDEQERLKQFLAEERHGDNDTRVFHGTGQDQRPYALSINPLVCLSIASLDTDQTTPPATTHYILNLREFPDTLLNPDPEYDKRTGFDNTHHLAFLEILRVTSGFHRPETDFMLEAHRTVNLSRAALQQGVRTALLQGNSEVLATLLKIDEYFVRCEQVANNITTNNNNNTHDNIIQPPYILPPTHYRTALQTSPHNPTPFQHLLRANAESLPPDDATITQWAMETADPALGQWLLDFMLCLPGRVGVARARPREEGMFYMGRGNGSVEMGGRYLREVLGVEGLRGWMEEVGFDFGSLVGDD